MNPDDLAKILDELGQRLGPAGQHVFELAIRQVYINAGVGLLLLVPVAIAWRWAIPIIRREQAKDFLDQSIAVAMGVVLGLIATGIVCVSAITSISDVLNPEYAALKDILSRIVPR